MHRSSTEKVPWTLPSMAFSEIQRRQPPFFAGGSIE